MTFDDNSLPTEETSPLLVKADVDVIEFSTTETSAPKVYRTRWLILALFHFTVVLRQMMACAWSPIVAALSIAYDWTKSDLALINGLQPFVYLFLMPLYVWFVNAKGLRVTTVLQVTCLLVAAGLKCLTSTPPYSTWLVHVAQIVVAPSAIYMMCLPPAISNTWFPIHERAFATALGYSAVMFGGFAANVAGPTIVRIDKASLGNVTELDMTAIVRSRIMTLNYVHCALSFVLFVAIVLFFRDRPPTPPSTTSQSKRFNFMTGIRTLATQKNFWLLATSFGLLMGSGAFTAAAIGVILQYFNIPQSTIPVLTGSMIVMSLTSSIALSKLTDACVRRLKLLILSLIVVYVVVLFVFYLYCVASGEVNVWGLAVCLLLMNMLLSPAVPLIVEYLCDLTYPVDESVTSGSANWMSNMTELLLDVILMLQAGDNIQWILWTLLGIGIVCLALVSLANEDYRRRDIDTNQSTI